MSQADTSRSTRGGSCSTSTIYTEPGLETEAQRVVSWTTCSISGQALQPPVVADRLGRLYSKDAVLELLLGHQGVYADDSVRHRLTNLLAAPGAAAALAHLVSIKDVFPVHLHTAAAQAAPSAQGGGGSGSGGAHPGRTDPSGSAASSSGAGPPVPECPVTGLPAGRYPFSALVRCGHVLSDRGLTLAADPDRADGIGSGGGDGGGGGGASGDGKGGGGGAAAGGGAPAAADAGCCPLCGTGFKRSKGEVVPLNPPVEVSERLRAALEAERAARQAKRRRGEGGAAPGRSTKKLLALPSPAAGALPAA